MKKTYLTKILTIAIAGAVFCVSTVISASADTVRIAVIDSGATSYVDEAISFTSFRGNEDPLNHGTKIARLIREGSPDSIIYMLQVCDRIDGKLKPSREAVLEAINWAVAHDVDIVNMSMVTKYDSYIEKAIKNAARNHGILFIAAGGNKTIASRFAIDSDGYVNIRTKPTKPGFPASSPYVISVGATDSSGAITNYSDKTCDVYAVGKIGRRSGTSFSCARITAAVARIRSYSPYADKSFIVAQLR